MTLEHNGSIPAAIFGDMFLRRDFTNEEGVDEGQVYDVSILPYSLENLRRAKELLKRAGLVIDHPNYDPPLLDMTVEILGPQDLERLAIPGVSLKINVLPQTSQPN